MSVITSYDEGDQPRIGNHADSGADAFTDTSGVVTDPTTITLTVKEPDGTATIYQYSGNPALFKETTGRYYRDVLLDAPGLWTYRLLGVGTQVQAAAEGQLHVRQSGVL